MPQAQRLLLILPPNDIRVAPAASVTVNSLRNSIGALIAS